VAPFSRDSDQVDQSPALKHHIAVTRRYSITRSTSSVRYDDSVERPSDGETEAVADLQPSFRYILNTTPADYPRAVRAVHAKGHGILRGTRTVQDRLAANLAQGLFAGSSAYEALLRISTEPGDILDDAVSVPRGIALKILGARGERLSGGEQDRAQDFPGRAFGAPTPAEFAMNLKLLAAKNDQAPRTKKALSVTLRMVESAIEVLGASTLISQVGRAPEAHALGETYISQTAFRYGNYIAKCSLAPVSPGLTDRTGDRVTVNDRPNVRRKVVGEVMIEHSGTWELCVQLCTDLEKIPIEDPTVIWDEASSPLVTVATLEVAPQPAWKHGTSEAQEGRLCFSPCRGPAPHRPLGAIHRARRTSYIFSADLRARVNACPVHGVKSLADLPV
jgi:hypothetical protein